MPVPYSGLQIAAGHNNAAGLVALESILVGNHYFYTPIFSGQYAPGLFKQRADDLLYISGFPFTVWMFRVLWRDQFNYLQTTYCAGGYSGLVTIRTRLDDEAAFYNCNTTLKLTPLSDAQKRQMVLTDYAVRYTRLEVI